MCKVKTPKPVPLPPPRANKYGPARSGAAAMAGARVAGSYSSRSQIPKFALPVLTAKLGGVPTVLGG